MQATARIRSFGALLLAAVFTTASAGCLTDYSALTIDGFQTIEIGPGRCDPGDFVTSGTLDTLRSTGFLAGVRITNGLEPGANPQAGVNESRMVMIDTVAVSWRTSVGAPFAPPPPENLPLSLMLQPGESVNTVVTLLTAANGASLEGASGGQLIGSVTLKGKTSDGAAISSVSAEFAISLCEGCMRLSCETNEIGPDGLPQLQEGFTRAACSPDSAGQPGGVTCVSE